MENKQNSLSKIEFIEALLGESVSDEPKRKKKQSEVLKTILDRAYDIRKFELDLYWKRATYFWGFLVAIFAGFFIVNDQSKKFDFYIQLGVACIGLIFSLAWYLVNRGSTYWVTNYERLIDAIEEYLGISFYNLNLENGKSFWGFSYYAFSVSRINIIVSFFIFFIWLSVVVVMLFLNIKENYQQSIDFLLCAITIVTLLFMLFLISSKSRNDNSNFEFLKRKTGYKKD